MNQSCPSPNQSLLEFERPKKKLARAMGGTGIDQSRRSHGRAGGKGHRGADTGAEGGRSKSEGTGRSCGGGRGHWVLATESGERDRSRRGPWGRARWQEASGASIGTGGGRLEPGATGSRGAGRTRDVGATAAGGLMRSQWVA